MFNLVNIKKNKTQLRNQINRINLEETDDEKKCGNIVKAMNIAIQELVDKTTDMNSENRRIIVIFTSKFDLDGDIDDLIKKLDHHKINIIIFGYEIDGQGEDADYTQG